MTGTIQLQLALDRVQDGSRNWYNDCYQFACLFLFTVDKFSSEDLIESYRHHGNPEPSEVRVWGAVIRKLSQENKIIFQGYQKYKNPKGHCKPSAIWKVIK